MKKLNVIITSAVCASLMAVNASAASDECISVFDKLENISDTVNSVNISCDPQTILRQLLSDCFNGHLPSLPQPPQQEEAPIVPDAPQLPESPELPEQDNGSDSNGGGDISGSVSSFERRVVELVNAERAKQGLAPLSLNSRLSDVAREKSRDMQANGYFSHTSPTYGSPFDMLRRFGISYNTAGENIAMGYSSPEAVVNGWMNSDGHRANILSGSFSEIGVGHVSNGNYWTQIFIG